MLAIWKKTCSNLSETKFIDCKCLQMSSDLDRGGPDGARGLIEDLASSNLLHITIFISNIKVNV